MPPHLTMTDTTVHYVLFDSPVGALAIAAAADGLRHIEFPSNRHPVDRAHWRAADADTHADIHATLAATGTQLGEYFAGTREAFDLPLAPQGTPFQQRVWMTLARIPYGATWTYLDLAVALGNPNATRAVGAANGRNPLPIVLPCHRVIGADGSLTGFGGGLPTKEALLRLEGAWPMTAKTGTPDLFG